MKNAPDDAKVLLDGLACAGHVATGLSVIKDRCDDGETVLKKEDVKNLKLYMDTLNRIEEVGRKTIQSICPNGGYIVKGYDRRVVADRKKHENDARSSTPYFIRKLREFKDSCAKGFRKKSKY